MAFLKPHLEKIYAVLRIVAGLLFMQHGLQKIVGLFGGMPPGVPEPVRWIAGLIELIGGLMIAVGFQASLAAFLSSGLMAFAYFLAHHDTNAPLPIQNKGELAVLYSWVFLYMATRGAGIWSVDGASKRIR